jgi:hypothetical protein
MRRVSLGGAALALLFLSASGCGGRYTPVAINGVVTLDGKPVEGASVSFLIVGEEKEGRPATGVTDATGTFHLSTMGKDDGALPGNYKVVIAKWVPLKPDVKIPDFPKTPEGKAARDEFLYRLYGDGPRQKNSLPARYGDSNNTPLSCSVDGAKTVNFELTSK